jgi:hypothetical protein
MLVEPALASLVGGKLVAEVQDIKETEAVGGICS